MNNSWVRFIPRASGLLFYRNLRAVVRHCRILKLYPDATISFGARVDYISKLKQGVIIKDGAEILNSTIEAYSYISENSVVQNTIIGRFCSVARDVFIGLGEHPLGENASTSPFFYSAASSFTGRAEVIDGFVEYPSTTIGSDVWIGARATLKAGISVGHGAVVTKDVPAYAIAIGVPAKILKYRFDEETVADLLRLRWYDRDLRWIASNAQAFVNKSSLISRLKNEGR